MVNTKITNLKKYLFKKRIAAILNRFIKSTIERIIKYAVNYLKNADNKSKDSILSYRKICRAKKQMLKKLYKLNKKG